MPRVSLKQMGLMALVVGFGLAARRANLEFVGMVLIFVGSTLRIDVGGYVKCYAEHLGDCAGGLTKEHYVSESVLKIAAKKMVTTFPWQRDGEGSEVGTSALTSKMLCKRHNEQLSGLDSAARGFVVGLKSSFQEATDNTLSDRTCKISGSLFELWLLKVLVGILAARKRKIPRSWVDLLFQRQSWPDGWGLYIFFKPSTTASWHFQLVRVITVSATNNPKHIAGAKFGIGGMAMLLAFGKPRFSDPGMEAMHRPGKLVIERDGKQNEHLLTWDDQEPHGTVEMHIKGEVGNSEQMPLPWVRPMMKNQDG